MSRDVVERIDAEIDALLSCDLTALCAAAVFDRARRLERIRRRLAAVDHQLLAELGSRRLAGEYGRASTADLLVSELQIAPGDAQTRVRQADDLGPRRSLTGELLPPLMPGSAAAIAAGQISSEHVAVIAQCLDSAPPSWPADALESTEATLIEFARHEHPGRLRRTAALLLTRLDPDGAEPRDEALHRRRDLLLTRNRDGSGCLRGRLTIEATTVWDTLLDALSAPVPADGGQADDRSAGQRRHDALVEAGQRLLRSGELPTAGGVPVTILARTTLAELRAGDGLAVTARGDVWPVAQMVRSASDGEIIPVLTGEDTGLAGPVLALGRTRRLASRAQRLALTARDGGCCLPACARPAAWCEVHHVVPWQDGGSTDLDNMCLVCRFHHREFEARGWQVRITDGLPEWVPPPHIDPDQRPRRNVVHHPPDLQFGRASPHAA